MPLSENSSLDEWVKRTWTVFSIVLTEFIALWI